MMDLDRPAEVTLFAVLLLAKLISVEEKVSVLYPHNMKVYERCMQVIKQNIG